jgi:hypothetical protein
MKNFWFHLLFHYESDDTALFYTRSDKVRSHLVLTLTCRSMAHAHLPHSECSAASNCPKKFYFPEAHIFKKKMIAGDPSTT